MATAHFSLRCPRNGQTDESLDSALTPQSLDASRTRIWEDGDSIPPARIPANTVMARLFYPKRTILTPMPWRGRRCGPIAE